MSGSVSSLVAMVTCTWPITSSCCGSISKRCVSSGGAYCGLGGSAGTGTAAAGSDSTFTGGATSEHAATEISAVAARSERRLFMGRLLHREGLLQQQRLVRQLVPTALPRRKMLLQEP